MSLPPAELGDAPSRRESQVAIAMLFGHTRQETAAELGISVKTVECYRQRLFRKFGARNSFQLAHVLMRIKPAMPEAAE